MVIPPRHLVVPSLAADALCLGPHWIYDREEIRRHYPDGISRLDAPRSKYHPQKRAGDFTHYGDQTLALLRSVAARGGFDPVGWRDDWLGFWRDNTASYRDGATRATLERIERNGHGASDSGDLGGAARIAPVLAASADPAERIAAARAQTALTHGDPATLDAAGFFARVVNGLAAGGSLSEAVRSAAGASGGVLDAGACLRTAEDLLAEDAGTAAPALGLACGTAEAFPLSLYFLLKYADQPRQALVANAMAGGDCAARGLLIGMVMGAAHGTGWLPAEWTEGLNAAGEIEELLRRMDP